MNQISSNNRYFWVGDGAPTVTKDVPIGAKYINLTGGSLWTLLSTGWKDTNDDPNAAPFDAGVASELAVLDLANGGLQELVLDEAHELGAPVNGTRGAKLELWVTADGDDFDLTFHTSILQQDGTTFDGTCTVLSGKTRILYFRYKAAWMLMALSGNF